MAIIRKRKQPSSQDFKPVRALVLDAIKPHEVHSARHFAHPNAARVWRGRF
ncbi:MAG: hypothetical protein AAGC96_07035 [Pseudomonadota bacterium]